MKKGDIVYFFLLIVLATVLIIPWTSSPFFAFSKDTPLLGGFIKFFVLASLGDILSHRITHKHYRVKGLAYKAVVWGFIGIVITLVFSIYTQGVLFLQAEGILPFAGVPFAFALFTSLLMNATFAPTMMYFHRVSDHYIEAKISDRTHRLSTTLSAIDTRSFIHFVVFKTIPLFWIPAHTVTFLLPETYRVLFAALLGIALGLLLGLAKRTRDPKDG